VAVRITRREPVDPLSKPCRCGGKLILGVRYSKLRGKFRRGVVVVCSKCDVATDEHQSKLTTDMTDQALGEWARLP
jgi:hypothetical protein